MNEWIIVNYRPISIIPNLKSFRRCLYNHLYPFFDKILVIQQCLSRKSFSVQHCIIRLLEKRGQYLDEVVDVLLAGIFKVFDYLT